MSGWHTKGFVVFDATASVAAWARAAREAALTITADPALRAIHLRHGGTWFVGVDALPNAADGSIGGVPLTGPWEDHIDLPQTWHPAQLSVVYSGYPRQDADESDAAHRFRRMRHAAHVDGLLPEGPLRRRFLREWHSFILGLPLNDADAAPLMVWPGSHHRIGQALRAEIGQHDPTRVDLTDAYGAVRRAVFDSVDPVSIVARPGQALLLHRHLLHGVAPFDPGQTAPDEGRMIAYLRPLMERGAKAWLSQDADQARPL